MTERSSEYAFSEGLRNWAGGAEAERDMIVKYLRARGELQLFEIANAIVDLDHYDRRHHPLYERQMTRDQILEGRRCAECGLTRSLVDPSEAEAAGWKNDFLPALDALLWWCPGCVATERLEQIASPEEAR